MSRNKTVPEPPRICEVLGGVQVNESWRVDGDEAYYRVNTGGMLEYMPWDDPDKTWRLSDVIHLTALINQPMLIIRGPIWTEDEKLILQQLQRVGVHWLSRDLGADVVDLWTERPEGNACVGYKGTMAGSVPKALFPSLPEGDVVCITEPRESPEKNDGRAAL